MAKFLFIYRESTESRPKPSPEEMQALQAAWYTWMQKFNSAIVPGGDGLKQTGRLVKDGLVTDGPYVEAKEIIVSFGVIQAFGIPILGYIYSPFEEIPNYAPAVRFVFLPVLVLSGLWMWKGHVLRRLFSTGST